MPMRGGREQFAARDPHRRAERAEHAAGEFLGHVLPVDLFDEDREFVAAQARDGVARAHGGDDAAPGFDQQFVADRVADRVVDQLEAIQVEEQHRERAPFVGAGACALDRVAEAFEQLRAIGQAGQRVVLRLVRQAALGVHALADLRHQFGVRRGEFARAFFDAAFEFGVRGLEVFLRLLALQARADVVRDERQQFLVARGERHRRRITLHGDHADHRFVAEQRHAEPVVRERAHRLDLAFAIQRFDRVCDRRARRGRCG